MLESLLSMFPALDVNVVTQTLQACDYIMSNVSTLLLPRQRFQMM